MHDAIDAAPLRQHRHERTGGERVTALRGRQQYNSGTLACCRDQNVETARGETWLNRHGTGIAVLRRQKPGVRALLLLVKDRKCGQFRWRRWFALVRQQPRTCDQDTPADADTLHLQVGVGVETLPNPDSDIDPVVDQIDPSIGDDTLET